MNVFGKSYGILVAILLVALLVILIVVYWNIDDPSNKLSGLSVSLAASLAVALIQLGLASYEYKHNEELRELELKEILYNRDSRVKYEAYIKKSRRQIDIMGVTASRFFEHFGDLDDNASEEAKALIYALERGVRVRILLPLPQENYLSSEEKMIKAKNALEKYRKLSARYDKIELKHFDHSPAHSIFRIDDTCIIGPVFPKVESKYTPALHLMNTSPMAVKYMDYFESEWAAAKKV